MRHQFDSVGREISVDADYLDYNLMADQHFTNHFYNAAWTPNRDDEILQGNLPSLVKIYSAKVDYSHPLKKDAKIEGGLKTSFVKTNNDAQYSLFQNNNWVADPNRSEPFHLPGKY